MLATIYEREIPTAKKCTKEHGYREKLWGSLNNGDGDTSEDVEKAIGLLPKTTSLHVHHAFLYISLPSLHDYDVKMPNCNFYAGRKQATTNLFFSLKTWVRSSRNQLQGNSPTLAIFSKLE